MYRIEKRKMSINANVLYHNMRNSSSSSSSSSSGENSYSVLIKKAMVKMPVSLNTKKSIDEYYKTAMEKINLKMKAAEKAKKTAEAAEKFIAKAKMAAEKAKEKAMKAAAKPKAVKAVKGSKTAKKPRAKKLVGGINEGYILNNFEIADKEIKTYNYNSDVFINSITNIINEINKNSNIKNIETAFTIYKGNKTEKNAIEIMRLISEELIKLDVI